MDVCSLNTCLDYAGSSGFIISTELHTALQSSLMVLKAQQKFKRIVLLGKIIGVKADYYLCQGVGNDELKDRINLYSNDCVKWGMMTTPDEETYHKCSMIKGRFMGDPSYEYEHSEKTSDDPEDQDGEEPKVTTIKEEDRLAIVVEKILHDAAAVPRGAFLRTSLDVVQKNRSFNGLSPTEATRISSYFHFRNPILLHEKSLLEKADLDKAIDFFDRIDVDIPQEGSWSVQTERGGSLVVLRSLHWLGFTCYHAPDTPNFGYFYCGTGEKNLDLPFML